MGHDANQDEIANPAADCPLSEREQRRNVILFGVNTGLSYLASPVLYVGVVHAALCEKLDTSATVANLPATAYLVMSPLPLLIAWLFPFAHLLKRVLIVCYSSLAVMSALVAVVLLLPAPTWLKVAVLILQGGLVGGARTVAVAFEFEVLGRAVSASRRGTALGLGYGAGPILAIVGALASQLLLTGVLGPISLPKLIFPNDFATLFAASAPIMAVGALLSSQYVIPLVTGEPPRAGFMQGVFGGFGKFLGNRIIRRSMIAATIVMAGYTIISNLTLYTRDILGESPSQFAGFQNSIRFFFKACTGLFLGWALTRMHPKAGVLITATAGLCGVLWAIVAPGKWFLLSFGLLGAAELFGIYVTNYILCCSPKTEMRRYMAFTMVTLFPAAFAGVLFGEISDQFHGDARAYGFRLSFAVSGGFIGLGLLLSMFLPARPGPEE